jgi:glutamate synthase (ferredoxin)
VPTTPCGPGGGTQCTDIPQRSPLSQTAHENGAVLDDELLLMAEVAAAIKDEGVANITVPIKNVDRSVCGRVAGQVIPIGF